MEWHDDPIRAQDTLRAAAWGGAWRMLGLVAVVLVFAAILFPVFAQTKVGPKLTASLVAGAIQSVRRDTGKWPTTFDEVRSRITFDDRIGPHRVSFVKTADRGKEADYAIAFDRYLDAFTLGTDGAPKRVGHVVTGTLPR